MVKSDQINELATALAKAQGQMRGAIKDQSNPFFKSQYADLASVVEAIRKPLSDNGICWLQLTLPSEKEEVLVETILAHSSGQWISGITAVPVTKADAQGFGSALTYARRYGLSAAAGVAPEDDDGNAAAKAAPASKFGAHKPTDGVKESLPEERQAVIETLAAVCLDFMNNGDFDTAFLKMNRANLDADEKVALWTYFDSKQRTQLKKLGELARGAIRA